MQITQGYTFDDVLLVPKYSDIDTRSKIDVSTELGKGVNLDIPILSANMKTVTGKEMATEMACCGGLGVLHRFETNQLVDLIDTRELLKNDSRNGKGPSHVCLSVGVTEKDFYILDKAVTELGLTMVCVDVAHGDHELCVRTVEIIANKFQNLLMIAGNVATGEGAVRLHNAGADVIKVGVGPGCFAAGTRVLLSNGTYKNIENITVGDRVINKDGKPVNVVNAFCTGVRRVSKIRHTLNHKPTYVTSDHNFWVGDLNTVSEDTISGQGYAKLLDRQSKTIPKTSKYKWKKIGDCKQDCLLWPKEIKFELENYFNIQLYIRDGGNGRDDKKKLDVVIEPSYNLGYLFGTFLGDGHAMCAEYNNSKIGAVHWYFGKNETDIGEKLSGAIKSCLGKEPKVEIKDNIQVVSLYYKPLADFLYKFGKKSNKHLPAQYLINNKDYLKGILDGLIDSDGYVEKNGRIRFTNTSEQLTELFCIINYLLTGVMPNRQMHEPSVGGLKNVNIKNCNVSYLSEILITGEKRLTRNYQAIKLLEQTELCNEVPVYDITVDCESHSFIADNAIVHNSLCTTRIETGNGVPQLTALYNVWNSFQGLQRPPKIIADGGIRAAGDIVKALCFSHAVMLGNILAGTDEAPGDLITQDGFKYKAYVGSSTHKTNHIEGVTALVPYKGPTKSVITKLIEGLKSGLSYQGAKNLDELRKNPRFVSLSHAGLAESHPHDVHL